MTTSRDATRQSLWTVAMLVTVWLAWMLRETLMVVGFAAVLAYALDPVVGAVSNVPLPGRRRVPRALAASIVMLTMVAIAWWALATVVPQLVHQLGRFADTAPASLTELDRKFRAFADANGWSRMLGLPRGESSILIAPLLRAAQPWAVSMLGGVFGNLSHLIGLVMLPVLAYYLIVDREAVRSHSLELVPEDLRPQADRVLDAVTPALRAYVRGQALVCFVMGSVMAVVLRAIGFEEALLLGVVIGFAEIVPYVGFAIAATSVLLAGFVVNQELALWGLLAYAVVNSLLGYLVNPRLFGREIKLHPFVVTVAIMAGTALLGPAGGILAVPAVAILQALIAEFAPRRPARASALAKHL